MREQQSADQFNAVSIWLASKPGELGADIFYVNTSGHPIYNVILEVTDLSSRYMRIPVLGPTSGPTPIPEATEYFAEEMSIAGDLRRPGVCFQFDAWFGTRYIKDHGGNFASVGGNPMFTSPHLKWLPQ